MPKEPMKVPYQVATLDVVPQPLRLFFTERDGAFHLNLDGEHPDALKLTEFRENNRSLNAKLQDAEQRLKAYEGIDPGEHATLKARIAELEGAATAGSESATKLAELQAALDSKDAALRETQRRAAIVAAFTAHGGEPKAADYVDQLAAATFQVTDGKLTTSARDAEGALLTVEGWLAQQQRERPFLFKPSRGGGASHSNGTTPSTPTVSGHDALEFGRNLEGIATGKVRVS